MKKLIWLVLRKTIAEKAQQWKLNKEFEEASDMHSSAVEAHARNQKCIVYRREHFG